MHALKEPEPDASAHSKRLCRLIRDKIIHSGGKIAFNRFMELALYAPGIGYYCAGAHKFGEPGDFVTAPEVSPLHRQTVCPGSGQLAQ